MTVIHWGIIGNNIIRFIPGRWSVCRCRLHGVDIPTWFSRGTVVHPSSDYTLNMQSPSRSLVSMLFCAPALPYFSYCITDRQRNCSTWVFRFDKELVGVYRGRFRSRSPRTFVWKFPLSRRGRCDTYHHYHIGAYYSWYYYNFYLSLSINILMLIVLSPRVFCHVCSCIYCETRRDQCYFFFFFLIYSQCSVGLVNHEGLFPCMTLHNLGLSVYIYIDCYAWRIKTFRTIYR